MNGQALGGSGRDWPRLPLGVKGTAQGVFRSGGGGGLVETSCRSRKDRKLLAQVGRDWSAWFDRNDSDLCVISSYTKHYWPSFCQSNYSIIQML